MIIYFQLENIQKNTAILPFYIIINTFKALKKDTEVSFFGYKQQAQSSDARQVEFLQRHVERDWVFYQ